VIFKRPPNNASSTVTRIGMDMGMRIGMRMGLGLGLILALSACAQQSRMIPKFPYLTIDGKTAPDEAGEIELNGSGKKPTFADLTPGPAAPKLESAAPLSGQGQKLSGEPKGIALEQVPIPAFIDTIFGTTLGLTYQVDPAVTARTETVTLRTGGPRAPQELFEITQGVLKTYGIRVTRVDDVVRVVTDQGLAAEVPQIIRGRTGAEVPSSMRPVFQVVYLESVSAGDMQNWLVVAFGKRATVTSFPNMGMLLVSGLPDDVRAVIDAIRLLDQPRLAGRQSMKIEPIYWGAERMARKLVDVLKVEGFNVAMTPDSGAAIVMLPVETINVLLIFTTDPKAALHVAEWLRELDRPAKADPLKKTFIYPVVSTTAATLGEVLGSVVSGNDNSRRGGASSGLGGSSTSQVPSLQSGGISSGLPGQNQPLGIPSAQGSGSGDSSRSFGGNNGPRIVIDELQNAIIFMGTAEEYAQILPLLQTLDKAPREALIEVTVAEVTLSDKEQLGVEWALKLAPGDGTSASLGTFGGLGLGATSSTSGSGSSTTTSGKNGFNFAFLNSAGQVRAALNALATDSRVNILLTPRLLARSGTEAQIKVGNEVPVITSQSNSPLTTGGTTSILNQVSYRTTGTTLRVKPTVHSGDRIDLEVSQEVSEAQSNDVSNVSSPLIFSRSISTKLSIKDGVTVLLGGLIQENRSSSGSKVPWVGDLPGIGNLFKNRSAATNKTELLIFITPYIVRSSEDAEKITGQFEKVMQSWPAVSGKLQF